MPAPAYSPQSTKHKTVYSVCATRLDLGKSTINVNVEDLAVNFLSLGRPEDRYPYILVMTNLFSKYAVAVPTKDQSASTTAYTLHSNLIKTSSMSS